MRRCFDNRSAIKLLAATLVAALALLTQCSIAIALSPGVHVDPGSPAGKQYGIPIASARGETAGETGSNANQDPPAFGVGIEPSADSASTSSATRRAGAKRPAGAKATGEHAGGSHAAGASPASGSQPGPPSGSHSAPPASMDETSAGGTGWLALILGGMLVLVLGGAGGLMLRRRAG